ncbi:hypothetical protein [Xanthomonas citri]|uniref:hypothetical protein n=1 Tax=Xanthomonas citri TaxID=346 RepID=UPI00103E6E9C|nr:hypothetical protein [Xanthomonas citri]
MDKNYPWEQSVVIALRDSQWTARPSLASPMYPDSYVALDGKPETKFGDSIFLNDEKLFLFEVKATEKQISDEWTKLDEDKKPKPKNAYLRLSEHLRVSGSVGEYVHDSISGHFFCYWSEHEVGGEVLGSLTAEPYLTAIARRSLRGIAELNSAASDIIKRYKMGLPISRLRESETGFETVDSISILHLITGFAVILESLKNGGFYEWGNLGMTPSEFDKYLSFLSGGEDELIRAVVLSSRGSFFRYVERTSELNSIPD